MKGFRERIKQAATLEEARALHQEAIKKVSEKAVRRCTAALNKRIQEGK